MSRQLFHESDNEEHAEMRTLAALQLLTDLRGVAIHAVTLPSAERRAGHYAHIEDHLAKLTEQQLHDALLHAIAIIGVTDANALGIPIAEAR